MNRNKMSNEEDSKLNVVVGDILLLKEKVKQLYTNLKNDGIYISKGGDTRITETDPFLKHIAIHFFPFYLTMDRCPGDITKNHFFDYYTAVKMFGKLDPAIQQINCSNEIKELSQEILGIMRRHKPIMSEIKENIYPFHKIIMTS